MSENGVRTADLPSSDTFDTVIGNKDGSTVRITDQSVAQQLMGSGPVAQAIAELSTQITSGVLFASTFIELTQIAPAGDGSGAEVLDTDTGNHGAATATGYDGASQPNAGKFAWNAAWGRWVRVGGTGLSSKADLINGQVPLAQLPDLSFEIGAAPIKVPVADDVIGGRDSAVPGNPLVQFSLGALPISNATAAALDLRATLEDGKIPVSQLPDAVLGSMRFVDLWNADTNTPPIPAAAPENTGLYYSVNVVGTTEIDGISDWGLGDFLVSNGTVWQKIDNSEREVTKETIGLGNVEDFSPADMPLSTASVSALGLKASRSALEAFQEGFAQRANVPGWQYVVRSSDGKLLLGIDDDLTLNASAMRLVGGMGQGRNNKYNGIDFALGADGTKDAWLAVLQGRLTLSAFDLVTDQRSARERGEAVAVKWSLNGKVWMQLGDDGLVDIAQRHLTPDLFGLPHVQVFNLRWGYDAIRYLVGTVNERGHSYDVRRNMSGPARSAAVIQHQAPMMSRIGSGQSTMGQSGDDPAVAPIAGARYPTTCFQPSRAQAYGNEAFDPNGPATIDPLDLTELREASDNGWAENFPMTLTGWAVEHLWRHYRGQTTPGQLGATSWEGGRPISSFRDGTSNFANVEVYLSRWEAMAAEHGRIVERPVLHYTQGEGGGATYEADLLALFGEYDAAWQAAGFAAPPKFVSQVNQSDISTFNPESRQAVVNLARDGECILVGPMYAQRLWTDGIHPNQNGDVTGANMSALAEVRWRLGLDTDPVWVTGTAVINDTAVLTYNLPPFTTRLEFNEAFLPPVPDRGYSASDSTGALTITDVSITANDEVTLNFDRAVNGPLTVQYGINTMDNTASGWGNGIGNLNAVCTAPALYGGDTFNGFATSPTILQPAVADTMITT